VNRIPKDERFVCVRGGHKQTNKQADSFRSLLVGHIIVRNPNRVYPTAISISRRFFKSGLLLSWADCDIRDY
jgi:hypothetical protein